MLEIQSNEEKFRSIYQMSYDGMLLTSPVDGEILSANPSACKLLGMTEQEICTVGRAGIVDLTDPRLIPAIKEREISGKTLTNLRFIKKDKTVIECEVSSNVYINSEGNKLSSMVLREITDKVKTEHALQESETKFSVLFKKSAFAASLSSAKDGKMLEVNDKFIEIFGYTRDELIGKSTLELLINPDKKVRASIIEQLRSKGSIRDERIELFSKTGAKRVMTFNLDLLRLDGEDYYLNTTQDITKQERVIEELQNSQENLVKAQRLAHLGNWTWTIPTNTLDWSDEMFTIFGITKDTFTGNLADVITSAIHPDDRAAVEEANSKVIDDNNPSPLIYKIITPDQSIKTVWAEAGELILDKQGKAYKLSGIVQDISERIKSEEKISMQANALEAAANAIVITGLDGDILWANSAFTQLSGYSESEYLGKNLRILNSGKQPGEFFSDMWNTILNGNVWHNELINRHKDGHLFCEEETITPILDRSGKLIHFVCIKQNITDRKKSETQIRNLLGESQQRLNRLQTLRDIDFAISSNYDLAATLNVVLQKVKDQLKVDAVAVLLYQESTKTFTYGGSLGLASQRIKNARVKFGESLAGKAADLGRIIELQKMKEKIDPYFKSLLDEEQIVDYKGIPLIAKSRIIGVLELYNKTLLTTDGEWKEYFETLAGQTAIAIENAQLMLGLQKTNYELVNSYDATIEGWSKALDLKDKETEGHTQRVTDLTLALAKRFDFSSDQIVHLRRGALLHDIGKMGIPDSILLKPDVLTTEERKIMQNHPLYAYNMLVNIDFLQPALEIPHLHHERWDGSGYPYGLNGNEIPLAARMFAVIDVFDALSSDRPYRSAWSEKKTIDYIREQSGKQFDPDVVVVFLEYLADARRD